MNSPKSLSNVNFNDNLSFVSKVEFGINSFRAGSEEKTYILEGDKVITEMDKDHLLNGLAKLNIGEWREEYAPKSFDIAIRDTFSWYLNIYFSNGAKPVKIDGCNNYPYNFAKLLELFDIQLFSIERF